MGDRNIAAVELGGKIAWVHFGAGVSGRASASAP